MNNTVKLRNGVEMPKLGLGLYKATNEEELIKAVKWALEDGYESFDTAQMYKNEEFLGAALKKNGVDRKKLFITSKIDIPNVGYENTLNSFSESLKKIGTDYLDLVLIHWCGFKKDRLLDTWRALEKLYKDGSVRAIGLSNGMIKHGEWIFSDCEIEPMVNQIEHHPMLDKPELNEWYSQRGVVLEAWSPLMRGAFENPLILELSRKYQRTPAQILLRWNLQKGFVVIPKSVHEQRIKENSEIFDFEISSEDMGKIAGLNMRKSVSMTRDPETYDY